MARKIRSSSKGSMAAMDVSTFSVSFSTYSSYTVFSSKFVYILSILYTKKEKPLLVVHDFSHHCLNISDEYNTTCGKAQVFSIPEFPYEVLKIEFKPIEPQIFPLSYAFAPQKT